MSAVRKPVNTTEQERASGGIGMLAESMAVGSSAAIEGQEAAGQREIVNSDVLPTDGLDRERFEALGFKVGKPVADDAMFTAVELPEGWSREGSDHAMWSYIVDERGMRRVAIFYKAAFYDRSAHCSIEREPRTTAQADYYSKFTDEVGGYPQWRTLSEMDGDVCVYTAHEQEIGEDGQTVYDHEAHQFKRTGKTVRRRIAMDGSET